MGKIKFTNQWSHTEVYIISKKDQDDLDHVIQYEEFFDEDVKEEYTVFVNDTMKKLWEYCQPETWNSKKFVELYKTLDQDNWYCTEE